MEFKREEAKGGFYTKTERGFIEREMIRELYFSRRLKEMLNLDDLITSQSFTLLAICSTKTVEHRFKLSRELHRGVGGLLAWS